MVRKIRDTWTCDPCIKPQVQARLHGEKSQALIIHVSVRD